MSKVIIETDLDNSGVQKGLERLGGILKTGVASAAKVSLSALAVVSTAIGAVTGAAIKFGTEYQQASNQIQAETGATAEEMEGLKDIMEDVYADNFGDNMQDAAAGVAEVKKQLGGLVQEDAFKDLTEDAFMMRDTFGYEVPESIRSVSTMIKQFGIDGAGAFNLIAQANQRGLDYSGELLDSINEYSVQFHKVGLDATDMFNIFESGMKNGAFNLDKIGDAVKEFSIRAIDGSKTTSEGFKLIGLNADEMGAKFAAGGDQAKEAFYQTIKALREMDDPLAQSTAGVDLFGTMWEDLGPTVVTQLDAVKDGYDATKDSMQAINDVKYDDVASALEALKRNLEVKILAPISEKVMPAISDATNAAIEYIDQISDAFETGGISGLVDETANIFAECASKAAAQAPKMIDAAVTFIHSFVDGLGDNSGELLNAGIQIVRTLSRGIVSFLPTEIQKPIQKTVYMITSSLKDGGLREGINSVKNLFSTLGTILTKTTKAILPPLTKAIDLLGDNLDITAAAVAAVTVGMKSWTIMTTSTSLIKKMTTAWKAATAVVKAHDAANRIALVAQLGGLSSMELLVGVVTGKVSLATAAQIAWNAAMNANPVAIVVTAVAALTAALLIYNATQDDTQTGAEKLQESQEKMSESFGKFGEALSEWDNKVNSAKSSMEGFNDSIIMSSEEQQNLSSRMQEVQDDITEIARKAAENRGILTQEEIDRLNELLEEMKTLSEKELAFQQARQDAVLDQAVALRDSFSGTAEEYEEMAARITKAAEDETQAVIDKAYEKYTNQVAVNNQLLGTTDEYNQQWLEKANAAAQEEYQTAVDAAEKKKGEILAIEADGMMAHNEQLEQFLSDTVTHNSDTEAENQRHNDRIKELREEYKVDALEDSWMQMQILQERDAKIQDENDKHASNLADINNKMCDNMDDTTVQMAAAWLQWIVDAEASGQTLTADQRELAANLVQALANLPGDMGETGQDALDQLGIGLTDDGRIIYTKGKKLGDEALQGEEDANPGGENSRAKGHDNGAGYAGGILDKIGAAYNAGYQIALSALQGEKDAQRSSSPSKEARKLGKYNAEGYALGIEDETASAVAAAKNMVDQTLQTVADAESPTIDIGINADEVPASLLQQIKSLGMTGVQELVSRAKMAVAIETSHVSAELTARANLSARAPKDEKPLVIDYDQLAQALIRAVECMPFKLVMPDGRVLTDLVTAGASQKIARNVRLRK